MICGSDSALQKAGTDGRAGYGCSLLPKDDGSVEMECPEDTVSIGRALCGGEPYDPREGVCVFDTVRSFAEFEKYHKCWEQAVDWSNHFCDTRDGHVYLYEKIGNAMWMAENLAYGDSVQTPSLIYGHDCSDVNSGCAYTWGAAMDSIALARDTVFKAKCGYMENNSLTCQLPPIVRGICPEGWHLPSMRDFTTMVNTLGKPEAFSFLLNRVGQTVTPRYFWTTEIDGEETITMVVSGNNNSVGFGIRPMNKKWYVRCLKD